MHVKLLMIDDEPAILKSKAGILEYLSEDDEHSNTYEISFATNGFEGLNKITNQTIDFNVILSDIKMPIMDGVTMLEKLIVLKPNIPVIMYSGHCTKEYNEKLVNEIGAFAAYRLPPDINYFIDLVNKAAVENLQRLRILNKI